MRTKQMNVKDLRGDNQYLRGVVMSMRAFAAEVRDAVEGERKITQAMLDTWMREVKMRTQSVKDDLRDLEREVETSYRTIRTLRAKLQKLSQEAGEL